MRYISIVKKYFHELQESICYDLAKVDGGSNFISDKWLDPKLGYGTSRIMTNGEVFKKAEVHFSHIMSGDLLTSALNERPNLAGYTLEMLTVSVETQPIHSCFVIGQAEIQFFIATTENSDPIWWFSGNFASHDAELKVCLENIKMTGDQFIKDYCTKVEKQKHIVTRK